MEVVEAVAIDGVSRDETFIVLESEFQMNVYPIRANLASWINVECVLGSKCRVSLNTNVSLIYLGLPMAFQALGHP